MAPSGSECYGNGLVLSPLRSAVRRLWPAHARPLPRRPRVMAASPADASRRRRENRRQLDARRSKCRIRLGGHMEQWCLLKEQLGFSLHSQLAKFLLDRLGPGRDLGEGTQRSPQHPHTPQVLARCFFLPAHFPLGQ